MLDTSTSPGPASDEIRAPVGDDRDAGHLLADALALTTRVDTRPNTQIELRGAFDDRAGTGHRARRAFEPAQKNPSPAVSTSSPR